MRVTTSKSNNSESAYITKSYTNAQGKSTSTTIKKLGNAELCNVLTSGWRHGVFKRTGKNETEKYRKETEGQLLRSRSIPTIMDYNRKKLFMAVFFLQSVIRSESDSIFRKIRSVNQYGKCSMLIFPDHASVRVIYQPQPHLFRNHTTFCTTKLISPHNYCRKRVELYIFIISVCLTQRCFFFLRMLCKTASVLFPLKC